MILMTLSNDFNSEVGVEPEKVRDWGVGFRTLITPYDNGAEQRRSKGIQRRIWKLEFRLEETEAQLLFAFFIAREGRYEAFCWTDPRTSTKYPVRFDQDELMVKDHYEALFVFEVTFIQVIGEECPA